MAIYSILVRNNSSKTQYFYVFQKQASFSNSTDSILSNSLGCQQVGIYSATGSKGQFDLDAQVYAGGISTMAPSPPMASLRANVTSSVSANQLVSLSGTQPKNYTCISFNPFALSTPTYDASLQKDTFAILVPSYTMINPSNLYCGVAVIMENDTTVLSNYVAPLPGQKLSCKPQPIYYIKVGYNPSGSSVEYDINYSAECDFSSGLSTIMVTYNNDGTFDTQGKS